LPLRLPAPDDSQAVAAETQAVDEAGRASADAADTARQPFQDAEAGEAQQRAAGRAGIGLRIVAVRVTQAGQLGAADEAQGRHLLEHEPVTLTQALGQSP
jgi:hypothetical protein